MNQLSSSLINNIQSIGIPTSLQCQLRCKYCYIHDPAYKTQPIDYDSVIKTLDAAVEFFPAFIKRKPVIIPWGAEPLCNWNVTEKVLRYAFDTYPCFVTTNWSTNLVHIPQGYFDFINEFANRIDNIQISFDGPEEVQNYSRVFANGKGSYARVRKNIDELYKNCPTIINKIVYKSTLSPKQLELHHYYKAVRFYLTEFKFPIDSVSLVKDQIYSPQAFQALKENFKQLKKEWAEIKSINNDAQ